MRYLHLMGSRPGPLFIFQNGVPLSRSRLNSLLTMLFMSAGDYTGHSFRIGAATIAARAGVPDHMIQILCRWSSDAYKLYIRSPESYVTAISWRLSSVSSSNYWKVSQFIYGLPKVLAILII